MKTQNRHYSLPSKNHDVVDDINELRSTFAMIDDDIKNCEDETATIQDNVEALKENSLRSSTSLANTEIQNIAPNRYLVVNQSGNGFECLDGGGDAGGSAGNVSVKKSDASFDTTWSDLLEISADGMTVQENSENGDSNQTHIFVDETEIENENQLPRVNFTNSQISDDFSAERNESVILVDSLEPQTERTEAIATRENYGLVKIGNGFENDNGTISYSEPQLTSTENFGLAKIGDGLNIDDGIISKQKIAPATFENYGVVKLGEGLSLNQIGEMEIGDMANAATIYNLGNRKICNNGIIELEEQTLQYRLFVTEDLIVQFKNDFEPTADFSFVLEIISDGSHLISFNETLNPTMQQLTLNRGTTRIFVTKQVGVPYYNATVSRLDAPNPILLTAKNDILSKFLATAPSGGNWHPHVLLQDYYDNSFSDIQELYFEFFTLVCIDYVNYWCQSNSVAMNSFILRGSNDNKNWVTLISKSNEIIYGKIETEIKGCFRYYNLKIGYSDNSNKPSGIMFFGTEIDNNENELINLVPYMSSNTTSYAKMTASGISSGSAANTTDTSVSTYIRVISDENSSRWIKYELINPGVANLLELDFYNTNTQANWFKLEGSNDDENYTLLLERQYQGNRFFNNSYKVAYYHLSNTTAYKYYKLTCVATNDSSDNWDLYGFRLFSLQNADGRWNFHRGIPTLSSVNQDGYEVSASSACDSGHVAKYAFDDNTQTRWATTANSGDAWLQIKLPNATTFNAAKIAPRGDNYLDQAPKDFEIQGSNDGETWNTLLSRTDESWSTLGEFRLFTFENENAYLYYRLYITANQGSSYKGCSCFILGNQSYDYKRKLHKYESLVPTMSSNSQDGYVASASSAFGGTTHPAYCAFDGVNGRGNKWLTANREVSGAWLKIKLPTAQVANAFTIRECGESRYMNRMLSSFKIQGSNDDSSWTDLLEVSDASWSLDETKTWETDNATAFQFYRILISSNCGASDGVGLSEWGLYYHYYVTEY